MSLPTTTRKKAPAHCNERGFPSDIATKETHTTTRREQFCIPHLERRLPTTTRKEPTYHNYSLAYKHTTTRKEKPHNC